MKFNKLRLLGFKSFVEPSEFIIERGLTGVVGPNGCGKSNLVEALRWVMGENSYKNMRASGMDDVIFSGSGNRPARNTAEVGLYLDNSDRTAPAAFNDADEIQVTRRIEREQGSVYRINGKEARAKDVQLLFADASTGARSPSMVGQGRIGELIQAKPQARRQLLEEAAGISGLHSRRHEAELRMRGAETNLERLEDVTAQLESQIESLKRQARQANRFRMLSADIRAREAVLLHIRWVEARLAEAEATSALNQATMVVAERAQAQMQAAKDQAIASLKLPELREDEAKCAAALQRLQFARAQLEDDASRLLKRRDELLRRLTHLCEDIRREERLVLENAAILERLTQEEAEIGEQLAEAGDIAEEIREAFSLASARLAGSEQVHQRLTAERAEASARRSQLERALRDLEDRKLRLSGRSATPNGNCRRLPGGWRACRTRRKSRRWSRAAEAMLAERLAAIQSLEAAVTEARAAESLARLPVDAARAGWRGSKPRRGRFQKCWRPGRRMAASPPVAEEITVSRGYEAAAWCCARRRAAIRAGRGRHPPIGGSPATGRMIRRCRMRRLPLSNFVQAPKALTRRPAPDRHRRTGHCRKPDRFAETRPAAGDAGRCRLALGRACHRSGCAGGGCPQACPEEPACRNRPRKPTRPARRWTRRMNGWRFAREAIGLVEQELSRAPRGKPGGDPCCPPTRARRCRRPNGPPAT